MKSATVFVKCLLLLSVILFGLAACDSNPKHTHNYNNEKLECSCGDIKSGVVAYIGSSYKNATARFITLQDAADYVSMSQNKGIQTITVNGYGGDVIECDGLIIKNSSINFDLSDNTVKFTNTSGITVSNSNASITIDNVDSTSGETLDINVKSGTLDVEASVRCNVTLSDTSTISFTGDDKDVEIVNFSSDSESNKITLQTDTVTIKDETVAQKVNKAKTEDSTSEIKVVGHYHSYNNEKLECSCGEISSDVIAYIGTNYKNASARFSSLEDASDYLKEQQSSSQITVYGYNNADIESGALEIENSNVKFDLSSNDVTFTQDSGITVTGSTVVFNAKSVSAESELKTELNSGTFNFNPNSAVTCSFILKNSSKANITSGDITVNSFSATSGCSICFTTSETVKVIGDSVYNSMKNYISNDSTSNIEVVGHVHNYDNDKLECYCGDIKEGVTAYIGSSYKDATARFITFQDAVDYVNDLSSSSQVTVNGYSNADIEIGALEIENRNVRFNLSSNDVTFTNGIAITGSTVVFNAKSVSAESELKTELNSSTFNFNPNSAVTCSFILKNSSKANVTSGDITVNSFSATSGCSICFTTSETVKVNGDSVYNSMKNYISNDSTSNIEIVGHVHDYDNVKLECWCGEISSDVIAYIGSSYKDATARFITLQDSADYVKNLPSSSQVTVNGRSKADIESGALEIEDSNVKFDLSSNDVTFTQTSGITVTESTVVFNAKSVSASLTLENGSTYEIQSGNVTINSFVSDDDSVLCLTTGGTVKAKDAATAKAMRSVLSGLSTSEITIDGHTHSFVKKYDEQQTVYWNECTSCGYCTEPQPVTSKWVSMFYLDMANLDALTDLEEMIQYNTNPENVTIYIITGGGYSEYSEYSECYNPYYKSGFSRSYLHPYLVEALENGGDTSHKLSFANSYKTNQYQYWKYYLDDSGKNSFVALSHTPTKLMSDGWIMKDFINYVYSIEGDVGTRYLLHMWNHGGGNLDGMMQDMTGSSWPVMTMKDMDDSVSATAFVKDGNSFDIALFDMCLMQQIENMNIIRDYAKCMIGSENSTYASHCGYLYYYINNNPDADYKDIATFFVEKTDEKQEQKYKYEERTWSAVDLSDSSKLDALNKAFDNFIKSIIDSGDYTAFEQALNDATYDYGSNSYDIHNVARLCDYSSLSALKNAISNVIIVNKCGGDSSDSTGLAFYFNTDIKNYIAKYGTENYEDYISRANAFYPNLTTLFEYYRNL